jgi:hypothetical protein
LNGSLWTTKVCRIYKKNILLVTRFVLNMYIYLPWDIFNDARQDGVNVYTRFRRDLVQICKKKKKKGKGTCVSQFRCINLRRHFFLLSCNTLRIDEVSNSKALSICFTTRSGSEPGRSIYALKLSNPFTYHILVFFFLILPYSKQV